MIGLNGLRSISFESGLIVWNGVNEKTTSGGGFFVSKNYLQLILKFFSIILFIVNKNGRVYV
jgi:hypothetical protein